MQLEFSVCENIYDEHSCIYIYIYGIKQSNGEALVMQEL